MYVPIPRSRRGCQPSELGDHPELPCAIQDRLCTTASTLRTYVLPLPWHPLLLLRLPLHSLSHRPPPPHPPRHPPPRALLPRPLTSSRLGPSRPILTQGGKPSDGSGGFQPRPRTQWHRGHTGDMLGHVVLGMRSLVFLALTSSTYHDYVPTSSAHGIIGSVRTCTTSIIGITIT